jgi:uncharacterized protein YcaQ
MRRLSVPAARRVAVAAQGLHRVPARPARRADVTATVRRLGAVQIDSVNVLARAHYLPFASRLGAYPQEWVDESTRPDPGPARLFEYWGHEASLLPVASQPLLRWRMEHADADAWGGMRRIAQERPDLVDDVAAAVAAEGPVSAAELEARHGRALPSGQHWGWRWSEVKRALEYLFWAGRVTAAGRGSGFQRLYDLPERVLPADVLAQPTPPRPEAMRALVEIAARAHGVATEPDLRDYFRLPAADSRAAVQQLVQEGTLLPVEVDGWTAPAFLHHRARVPRAVSGRALLAPFDPLVWTRPRAQRLFGFRYRLEIYVPRRDRVHGYYVLPFLLGDQLVARVDLKADRPAALLRVQASWAEPDAPAHTAAQLAEALRDLAGWRELEAVAVEPHGDLAADLAGHLRW